MRHNKQETNKRLFNTKSGFAKLEFTRFRNVQSLINQNISIVNHSRSFQYTRCGYELFGFKIKILHFNPLVTLSGLVKTKKTFVTRGPGYHLSLIPKLIKCKVKNKFMKWGKQFLAYIINEYSVRLTLNILAVFLVVIFCRPLAVSKQG